MRRSPAVTVALVLSLALLVAACTGGSSGEPLGDSSVDSSGESLDESTIDSPGLISIDDLDYEGAFRLDSSTFGASDVNYAVGRLAYHAANDSLFVVGHEHDNAVAEFPIPGALGGDVAVVDLPVVEPLQGFVTVLDRAPTGNSDDLDRITGMYVSAGQLIVNAEEWYDADRSVFDTTLVLSDADDLDGPIDGYFQLDGRVHAGGYMSPIPTEWQDQLGGPVLVGWASNSSIVGRYSVGPSLFAFDPTDVVNGDAAVDPAITTTVHLEYPYGGGHYLGADALDEDLIPAPELWNHVSSAVYGFIVPGTRTFMAIGEAGGLDTGIGYKITQDNGNLCGGYCPYGAADQFNYYWMFDLGEIVEAPEVYTPRPYAYGRWEVPYDDAQGTPGQHSIIGATFDRETGSLYIALAGAGQVGEHDRPPLIIVYHVEQPAGD